MLVSFAKVKRDERGGVSGTSKFSNFKLELEGRDCHNLKLMLFTAVLAVTVGPTEPTKPTPLGSQWDPTGPIKPTGIDRVLTQGNLPPYLATPDHRRDCII